MCLNAIVTVSMLLILATTASLYKNIFNIEGAAFALYFAVHGIGIIIGQFANHRLIGLFGVVRTTIIAAMVMITSTLIVALSAFFGFLSAWSISFSLILFAVGYLSVVANSISLVLQPHGTIIGFAVALQGLTSMLFGGLVSSVVALFVQDNIYLWVLGIAVPSVIVLAMLVIWSKGTASSV